MEELNSKTNDLNSRLDDLVKESAPLPMSTFKMVSMAKKPVHDYQETVREGDKPAEEVDPE